MSAHSIRKSKVCWSLGLFALALAPLGVFGQGGEKQLGNESLEAPFRADYQERVKLLRGDRPPGKADQELMDRMAKYYFYRVTWTKPRLDPVLMSKVVAEFESDFVAPALPAFSGKEKDKDNKAFIAQLGKYAAGRLKEIFDTPFLDNRTCHINAGVLMVSLCRFKQEEVATLLEDLIQAKDTHPAVKLYALKGMREFFPIKVVTDFDDPKDKRMLEKKDIDLKRIKVLAEYVHQRFPTPASAEELEALRFIRREAIASLAQVGAPAVSALKKEGKVEGAAAHALIRVLLQGREGLQPEPSLTEKVEAALGLCKLKQAETLGYDPSVGVYLIAQTLVDFTGAYRKDFVNIAGGKVPFIAWRTQAERFKEGLKELVANTADTPAKVNAARLEAACKPFWPDMQGKKFQQLQNYDQFLQLVPMLLPKSGNLFRLKGPEIDVTGLKPAAPMDN